LAESNLGKEDKETEFVKIPKQRTGEILQAAAKAGLSTIPIAGGPLAELLGLVIGPKLNERREKWLESIAERLVKLEEKDKDKEFKIENLINNENFTTAFAYAMTIAVRNHQEEKIEALRNAVLNTALLSSTEEEDLHLMFLNFVDVFTPWHIRLLLFFDNPKEYCIRNNINVTNLFMGSPSRVLEQAFPSLRRDFYDQITKDLYDRGLSFDTNSLHVMTSNLFAPRITIMGIKFLRFISATPT
jgi:hypothetical protein